MNLTLHIVRKDLIRMRWWLVGWVAVLLIPIGIGVRLVARSPFDGSENWALPNTYALVLGFEALVAYLLTLVLFQEDAVVGTNQFWLTRPIARGRLLLAKAAGAMIMVGLTPAVVSLPWWMWCGLGAAEIATAALEMLALAVLITIPAALVAVMTDSLARALLWTLVFIATLFAATLFFIFINTTMVTSMRDMALVVSRATLTVIVIAAQMAIVVVVQFLVRRRGWWLAAAGAVMATSLFATSVSQWSWMVPEMSERHSERAAGVTVTFDEAVASEPRPPSPGSETFQRVSTRFAIDGVPPGLTWIALDARQSWQWPDLRLERETLLWEGDAGLPPNLVPPPIDAETAAWHAQRRAALDLRPSGVRPAPERKRNAFSAVDRLRPSLVARTRRDPPTYEAQIRLQLAEPELLAEVPLRAGKFQARAGHGLRVGRLEQRDVPGRSRSDISQLAAVILKTNTASIWRTLHAAADQRGGWLSSYLMGTGLMLINRERGEAIGLSGGEARTLVVNGVRVEWRSIPLSGLHVIREGRWVHRPGWIEGASVGLFRLRNHAVFTRDVRVDNLEVRLEPPQR